MRRRVEAQPTAEAQRTLVNCTPEQRWSALHQAAAGGEPSIVLFLLSKGADAALRNRNGQTPLQVANAAANANPDVRRLLEAYTLGTGRLGAESTLFELGDIAMSRLSNLNLYTVTRDEVLRCSPEGEPTHFAVVGPTPAVRYLEREFGPEAPLGFLGPTARVTLRADAHEAADILPTARYFAFSYPINGRTDASELMRRFALQSAEAQVRRAQLGWGAEGRRRSRGQAW